MSLHYVQPNIGRYGVFNGNRFRTEIAPWSVGFHLQFPFPAKRLYIRDVCAFEETAKDRGETASGAHRENA